MRQIDRIAAFVNAALAALDVVDLALADAAEKIW
jgi:hypothetical protein